MSKTSEENLIEAAARAYWKRFAASVIAFAHKYRFDLFFRTEFNIIALQVAFSLFILAVVYLAFTYLYRDITTSLLESVAAGQSGLALIEELEYLRARNLIAIIMLVIALTAMFGYIVAHITLAPTRSALSSQKQFIGNVAHELRTPLSVIKTNTEVALLETQGDDTRKIFRSNLEELDRISDIIDNLLSLNAFIRPERMEFKNTDFGKIVARVLQKLHGLAERKHIKIRVKKSDFAVVWGNEAALEQVAMNVIKNAITYTEGGEVLVAFAPDYRGHIEFAVKDTGIGIAHKDLVHIFEPFYRADSSRARQTGGSGLGLTIVSELIKLHKGKIVVQSAPKKGTTVMITLPCGKNQEMEREHDAPHPHLGEVSIDFSNAKRS